LQKLTPYISREDAISLLKRVGCDDNVIKHCLAVSKTAKDIAQRIKRNGHEIDVHFVEIGALLHDIGRCKTHGISHGIEGAKILRNLNLDKFAHVCETHIGAGLSREEAESHGLPARDYIPETLEEKVIAHADNLTMGTKKVGISITLRKLKRELGKNHQAIKRVKELNDFIEGFLR